MLRKVILRAQLSSCSLSYAACTCEGLVVQDVLPLFTQSGSKANRLNASQHLLIKSSSVIFWMTYEARQDGLYITLLRTK